LDLFCTDNFIKVVSDEDFFLEDKVNNFSDSIEIDFICVPFDESFHANVVEEFVLDFLKKDFCIDAFFLFFEFLFQHGNHQVVKFFFCKEGFRLFEGEGILV
jgi:hypothetical protein